MENELYKMMITNAKAFLQDKEVSKEGIDAFRISEVLAICTGKLKEDIVLELAGVGENNEPTETPLNQEIIESYEMRSVHFKPDYDDSGNRYTLPCGHDVEGFYMLNGESCSMDALEGMGGWLYINTKEELDAVMKMNENELFAFIEKDNEDFDRTGFE